MFVSKAAKSADPAALSKAVKSRRNVAEAVRGRGSSFKTASRSDLSISLDELDTLDTRYTRA